jgi:hypothetical protein
MKTPKKGRGLFRWCGSKRHLVERIAPFIRVYLAAKPGGRLENRSVLVVRCSKLARAGVRLRASLLRMR